ncbi:hypothetical protein J1614_009064 [Plenodomus biglobosus]|nr:hypothetical protein J1614_009064 [Plenodomus biglobosus]
MACLSTHSDRELLGQTAWAVRLSSSQNVSYAIWMDRLVELPERKLLRPRRWAGLENFRKAWWDIRPALLLDPLVFGLDHKLVAAFAIIGNILGRLCYFF